MTVIRQILKNKGESVSDIYRKIGGNRGYLFEICSGTRRATAPIREKIAGALGLPEAELFDERGMARFEEDEDKKIIPLRTEESEKFYCDLATHILKNKGRMKHLTIDYFIGGVELTVTFMVADFKKFRQIEEDAIMSSIKIGGSE